MQAAIIAKLAKKSADDGVETTSSVPLEKKKSPETNNNTKSTSKKIKKTEDVVPNVPSVASFFKKVQPNSVSPVVGKDLQNKQEEEKQTSSKVETKEEKPESVNESFEEVEFVTLNKSAVLIEKIEPKKEEEKLSDKQLETTIISNTDEEDKKVIVPNPINTTTSSSKKGKDFPIDKLSILEECILAGGAALSLDKIRDSFFEKIGGGEEISKTLCEKTVSKSFL